MRDWSLHILDLIENSTRAGARHVRVTIEQQPDADRMFVSVEDDGPGLPAPAERATDPFFTTKSGKRVGLGLSLVVAAAERAGGEVALGCSPLGGLAVRATMRLSHVDRSPLGDVASTLSTACCAWPDVRFTIRLAAGGRERVIDSASIARSLAGGEASLIAVAQAMGVAVRSGVVEMCISQ